MGADLNKYSFSSLLSNEQIYLFKSAPFIKNLPLNHKLLFMLLGSLLTILNVRTRFDYYEFTRFDDLRPACIWYNGSFIGANT